MTSYAPLLVALLAVWGCGPEPEATLPAVEAVPPAQASGGTYQVEGLTVELQSGDQRKITGTVIMSRRGSEYRSSFALESTLPSPDGALYTEVIGTGDGEIDPDGVLRGTARTQLVIGPVAGIPTQFPFIPRIVGPRIVSETVTVFGEDGSIEIEIQTKGEPGENYRPTRTTLKGSLVPGSQTGGVPALK